jgi:hypothetical protein
MPHQRIVACHPAKLPLNDYRGDLAPKGLGAQTAGLLAISLTETRCVRS